MVEKSKLIIIIFLGILLFGVIGYLTYSMFFQGPDECEKLMLPEGTCSQQTIDAIKVDCENFGIPQDECTHPRILAEIEQQTTKSYDEEQELEPIENETEPIENETEPIELDDEYDLEDPLMDAEEVTNCDYYKIPAEKCTDEKIEQLKKDCNKWNIPDVICKYNFVKNFDKKCEKLGITNCNYTNYVNKKFKEKPGNFKCINYKIPDQKCNKDNIELVEQLCNYYKIPDKKCRWKLANKLPKRCKKLGVTDCTYSNYKKAREMLKEPFADDRITFEMTQKLKNKSNF